MASVKSGRTPRPAGEARAPPGRSEQSVVEERWTYHLSELVGTEVLLTTKNNATFVGLLHAVKPDKDKAVVLAHVKSGSDKSGSEVKAEMIFPGKEIVSIVSYELSPNGVEGAAEEAKGKRGFKTDAEVLAQEKTVYMGGKERELKAWDAPAELNGTHMNLNESASMEPFDQFKSVERMNNVKTTYHENFYTTALDPTKLTPEQRKEAERLAKEIEDGGKSYSKWEDSQDRKIDDDEEARFSAVLGTGGYKNGKGRGKVLAQLLSENSAGGPSEKEKKLFAPTTFASPPKSPAKDSGHENLTEEQKEARRKKKEELLQGWPPLGGKAQVPPPVSAAAASPETGAPNRRLNALSLEPSLKDRQSELTAKNLSHLSEQTKQLGGGTQGLPVEKHHFKGKGTMSQLPTPTAGEEKHSPMTNEMKSINALNLEPAAGRPSKNKQDGLFQTPQQQPMQGKGRGGGPQNQLPPNQGSRRYQGQSYQAGMGQGQGPVPSQAQMMHGQGHPSFRMNPHASTFTPSGTTSNMQQQGMNVQGGPPHLGLQLTPGGSMTGTLRQHQTYDAYPGQGEQSQGGQEDPPSAGTSTPPPPPPPPAQQQVNQGSYVVYPSGQVLYPAQMNQPQAPSSAQSSNVASFQPFATSPGLDSVKLSDLVEKFVDKCSKENPASVDPVWEEATGDSYRASLHNPPSSMQVQANQQMFGVQQMPIFVQGMQQLPQGFPGQVHPHMMGMVPQNLVQMQNMQGNQQMQGMPTIGMMPVQGQMQMQGMPMQLPQMMIPHSGQGQVGHAQTFLPMYPNHNSSNIYVSQQVQQQGGQPMQMGIPSQGGVQMQGGGQAQGQGQGQTGGMQAMPQSQGGQNLQGMSMQGVQMQGGGGGGHQGMHQGHQGHQGQMRHGGWEGGGGKGKGKGRHQQMHRDG